MVEEILPKIQEWFAFYGLNILGALLILLFGRWIALYFKKISKKLMTRKNVDPTIVSFINNLAYAAMFIFVIMAALSKIGIQTTSIIAVIGAAGLAIGLALQGSLSNFAAGFLLIIFRPISVGDYIEGAGTAGTVEEVQLFTTHLKTADNKSIYIPNSKLTSGNIINYSDKVRRRLDISVGISYDADIDQARDVLLKMVSGDQRYLSEPEPRVVVKELADSSVNIQLRAWVNTVDYWDLLFETTENVKKQLDSVGISIPYPQRDVHLVGKGNEGENFIG